MTADATLRIREATRDDTPVIAAIHAASWLCTYAGTLRLDYLEQVAPQERMKVWQERFQSPRPDQIVLVAELDGEIVGFICAFFDGVDGSGAYIDNLHIVRHHQGKGFGRALLRAMALRFQKVSPQGGMSLTVTQANTQALHFYLRMGAQNSKVDIWNAPDGSVVPVYWIVWTDLKVLIAQ